jgi:outer membrane protein OmpA-like peptidoglycan-associated protein/tetratricopeptide (TPR) repeat protein
MRYGFTLFIALLFFGCAEAQMGYSTKDKKAIKYFEAGKTAPDVEREEGARQPNYQAGIEYMEKALDRDANFIEAHLLKAELHEYLMQYDEAIDHYKKSLAINPNYLRSGVTYFYLGNLQHAQGEYSDAIKNLDIYLNNRNANPQLQQKATLIRANAVFAREAIANPLPFDPINIGPGINTENPEYFPTITVDGETILFTRRIPDGRVQGRFKEQEDFFVSQLSSKVWQTAVPMPTNVNTVNNEGAPTIAADGRTLIFVGCADQFGSYGDNRGGRGSCDLFITKKLGARWTDPENLPGTLNTIHWETQPSLSSDGKTLYFIRGIRGRNATNNSDIYVSHLQPNGEWSTAERLPDHINTPDREESVMIHPDGKTLYFASRGHIGMGGSDLYVTRMDDQGNWSKPKNLGYPINTKYDENSLMVGPDGEVAFFASDREGGYGDLDIYYFIMPQSMRPTKTLYFEGFVYDINSKDPLPGKFQLIDIETGKEVIYSEADPLTGEFTVSLPVNKEYALNVSYPGYAFYSENFNMTNPEGLEAVHKDVPLVPLSSETGTGIPLANVFFDLDKATLRKKSFVELDKLVAFLAENPEIYVEIGGHTDSRGNNNQELSENRAKAVLEYVASKGISKDRMTSKGYGSSKPIISDKEIEVLPNEEAKEAAHQKNRRVEYMIVSK